ncbi:hypothetical protein Tco_0394125 [Tanacetum coccineum]
MPGFGLSHVSTMWTPCGDTWLTHGCHVSCHVSTWVPSADVDCHVSGDWPIRCRHVTAASTLIIDCRYEVSGGAVAADQSGGETWHCSGGCTRHTTPTFLSYHGTFRRPLNRGGEVISTTPARENDEFIKSSVDDLVLIPNESKVTSDSYLECDMPVNTPLPTIDDMEENFDINSPLGEHVVNFLMENEDIPNLPRHLVKQLISHLVKNPSSTKRVSNEPLGDDSKPRSYDVTFLNSLFEFNDDYTLCYYNLLFDDEFEDISGKTRVMETPSFGFHHIPSPRPVAYSPKEVMYHYYHPHLTSGDGFDSKIKIIPLGQKNTLAEYMILFGADNHLPMLDKDLYDSWKKNGVIRTKKYAELFVADKIQADCDMKATNIILQGLPADIYSLKRECKLYDAFDKFTHIKRETLHNKFMTDVKLMKDLHTTNFDQLHAYLEQHELHANEIRLLRERNQDPLAFVANQQMTPPHFNTYQSSYNNPQLQQ